MPQLKRVVASLFTLALLGVFVRTAAAAPAQAAVNHSAPYTRLLGPATTKAPVKFAQRTYASAQAQANGNSPAPVQNIGWRQFGYGYPYYSGYGGYFGPGFGYASPYYSGAYAGWAYPYAGFYRPYVYSYQPWIGGWGGYPYYSAFNPGFGGYYGTGGLGYVGAGAAYNVGYGSYGGGGYSGYGGCCYW